MASRGPFEADCRVPRRCSAFGRHVRQLKFALKTKPLARSMDLLSKSCQVYLTHPEASYRKALQVAPEPWASAELFRQLLLEKPQVLDLSGTLIATQFTASGRTIAC